MMAANLMVRDEPAYLLTDSAALDENGHAVSFEPKVGLFRSLAACHRAEWNGLGHGKGNHSRMDGSASGWGSRTSRATGPASGVPRRFGALVRLAGVAAEVQSFRGAVVFQAGRAEGYILASHAGGFAVNVEPDHAYLPEQFICPRVDRAFYPENPELGDLRLLEAQRGRRNPRGRYTVGGSAHLTIVRASDVQSCVLRQWPDVIGQSIDRAGTRCALTD